jgi:hypothetical protein
VSEEKEQKCFSKKYGYSSLNLQIEEMDAALRMDIWNLIFNFIKDLWISKGVSHNAVLNDDCRSLWGVFFKKSNTQFPVTAYDYIKIIESEYNKLIWYRIYDLIEYFYSRLEKYGSSETFKEILNDYILETNASAYRLVNGCISPVTDPQGIDEIESTIALLDKNSFTRKHLEKAQKFFSNRGNPDYRESCNESLHAIAAFLEEKLRSNDFLENKKKLNKISQKNKMFWNALDKLYAIRNDNTGHHEKEGNPELTLNDAIFIHRSACAWISYLETHLAEKLKDAT